MVADDRDTQDPEYDYYDSIEEEEEGGRGPVLAVVGLIVFAAFAGVVWVAYQQGVREGQRSAPPILRADASPAKEKPAEPGGRVVPGQDKRVFDAVTGETREEPEQLLPPAEEPMSVPPGTQTANAAATKSAAPAPAEPSGVAPATASSRTAAPSAAAPAAKPAASVAAEAMAKSPAQALQGDDTLTGNWLVQIGSYRSHDEALQAWSKAQVNHSTLLQGFQPDVMQVDLGARGLYQRLRFGPFDTRDTAVSACESLKAERQDCFVVER